MKDSTPLNGTSCLWFFGYPVTLGARQSYRWVSGVFRMLSWLLILLSILSPLHPSLHSLLFLDLLSGRLAPSSSCVPSCKVRLTNKDMEEGNVERMNENDGGLARHSTVCKEGIDWESARIIGGEKGWRKMLEGLDTVTEKSRGRTPLNTCNQTNGNQPYIYIWEKLDHYMCVPPPCKNRGGNARLKMLLNSLS